MQLPNVLAGFGLLGALVSVAAGATTVSSGVQASDVVDDLNSQAIEALRVSGQKLRKRKACGCTVDNASVRRNWVHLSAEERKSYIGAVQCLLTSPSKADPSFAPGARNRYDDFVAVHMNQTRSIHGTGNFLSWHRYFVWAYEKALRTECGYKGYQPYWDWFSYQDDLTKSPVFDGSDTSMSGDGAFLAHNGSISGGGAIFLPSGKGGGCVTQGPFKNMTVNIGPLLPAMDGQKAVTEMFQYNPRCLSRDLSAYTASAWLTAENLLNITMGEASGSIQLFQDELQGRFKDGFLGLHTAGHMTMGGEAGDFYSSPNDPAFWLHHSMLDRVWWIWQALHPQVANTIAGTITVLNNPPSRNASVEDIVDMGVNGPTKQIKQLMNTLGHSPFCYIYL